MLRCRVIAAVAAACIMVGCKTMPMPRPEVISVPNGLSEQQIEAAIFDAIKTPPQNSQGAMVPGALVVARPADALILSWLSQSGEWFPESQSPGLILAGYQQSTYYLRVAIHYNVTSVTTEIVDSRNLNQTDTRIHKSAVAWAGLLDTRIRRSLGARALHTN